MSKDYLFSCVWGGLVGVGFSYISYSFIHPPYPHPGNWGEETGVREEEINITQHQNISDEIEFQGNRINNLTLVGNNHQ